MTILDDAPAETENLDLAPQDADSEVAREIEKMPRPFRLGLVGLGSLLGLALRMAASNSVIEETATSSRLLLAGTMILIGLGLLLMAAERDRFSPPLYWIVAVTAASWGVLNWISPLLPEEATRFDAQQQLPFAAIGIGNGLVLAGIITLAFVRRAPTLTVAATLFAGLTSLLSTTVLFYNEWSAIAAIGLSFALVLVAWDQSPRRELNFDSPEHSPRSSRAALSLVSVVLCGTALQLWLSRSAIPRVWPAVIAAVALVAAAFASMWRVRREIEQRQTITGEWRSWMREIRHTDMRSEMKAFEPAEPPAAEAVDASPETPRQLSFPGLLEPSDTAAPPAREPTPTASVFADLAETPSVVPADLGHSIPTMADGLVNDVAEQPAVPAEPAEPQVPEPAARQIVDATQIALPLLQGVPTAPDQATPAFGTPQVSLDPSEVSPSPAVAAPGAFSAMLGTEPVEPTPAAPPVPAPPAPAPPAPAPPAPAPPVPALETAEASPFPDLAALAAWLAAPEASTRVSPLLVAIEAMPLGDYDSLPAHDAPVATNEIGSYLVERLPDADLVCWIDGPYFLVAYSSMPATAIPPLNTRVTSALKATDGTLAFVRPGPTSVLDDLVEQAVLGLLHARRNQEALSRR